jgi:hypothetical protein
VVWLSKSTLAHLEYQYQHSYADILFARDLNKRALFYNTGFFYTRANEFVKNLFYRIIAEQNRIAFKNSEYQIALDYAIRAISFNDSRVDSLDLLLYANGVVHDELKLNEKMCINPLIVDAHFLNNHEEKTKALQSENLKFENSIRLVFISMKNFSF